MNNKRTFILSLILIIMSFIVIGQIMAKVTNKQNDEVVEYYDLFNEVMLKIQNEYVEDVTPRQLMEGAIRGMIMSLDDPHSQFLAPKSFNQLEEDIEGEFSGIGIHIGLRDGILTVIAPIPGSPSARLGLQSWDRIVEIEGKSTEGMGLEEAVKLLKGPEGTKVKVTIFRKGATDFLHFDITRAKIKVKSVYSTILEDNIGYVRLSRFSQDTSYNLNRAVTEMRDKKVDAIILDLRWNSGGSLREAIEVCDLFLEKGKVIVSTEGRNAENKHVYHAKKAAMLDVPLAVLINHGSASASEIVTGAMKDHKRGIIIGPKGEKTWGKGSVQTIEPLVNTIEKDEDGNYKPSALRITTAYYLTPSGIKIHKIGIEPDIEIELPAEHVLDLQRHGLLGEPNLVMDDDKKVSTDDIPIFNGNNHEKKEEDSEKDESDKSEKKESIPAEKEDNKKFVDIQLNEAVKILKAHMILQTKKTDEIS